MCECVREAATVPTRAGANVRYVVPHRIDPETLTHEDVMLQMRVTQPLEQPVRIEVRDGDELIASRAERYARPGEMASITLRGKAYDQVRKAASLSVHVVPR